MPVAGKAVHAEARPVPVADPVVDVAGHVVTAVRAGAARVQADGGGAADGVVEVGLGGRGPVVAPGVAPAVGAAGRLLPLRVGGQAPAGPAGVGVGLVPADAGDRLVLAVPAGDAPRARLPDLVPALPRPAARVPPGRVVVAA